MKKINVLLLGSKEFPVSRGRGDSLPSGGMEVLINNIAPELSALCNLTIVTRRLPGTGRAPGKATVYRVPFIRGKYLRGPTFNIFSFFKSLGIIRKQKIDAILCFGIMSSTMGHLLGKLFRKPVISCPCGIGFVQFGFPINRALKFLEKNVYRRCNTLVFNSEGELEIFRDRLKARPRKIRVIPPGIEIPKKLDKAASRKSLGIKGTAVLTVSRLVPVKGLDYLVKAMRKLRAHLYMVGKGPEEDNLKRLAGDSKNITLTGFLSEEKKRKYISASDIFAVPSLSEGLPLSLLEAMSQGKACVVTDIGLPVENMKTGLVVPPGDTLALAKAVDKLSESPALRKRLGDSAERFVKRTYTKKRCAERYLETIRNNLKY